MSETAKTPSEEIKMPRWLAIPIDTAFFVCVIYGIFWGAGVFPTPARCLSGAVYGIGYAAGFVVEAVDDGYRAGKYEGSKDG